MNRSCFLNLGSNFLKISRDLEDLGIGITENIYLCIYLSVYQFCLASRKLGGQRW